MPTYSSRRLVDSLAQIAREYRHFQQEHDRESPEGATRHGLEVKIQRLRERFERMVSHFVEDEALRAAWTRHLFEGGPSPSEPEIPVPPTFKGVTETGSRVEVRPAGDGGYDLVVDGTVERHEGVPWHLDPDVIEPIQIGGHTCREIYEAPPEALAALARFLATPHIEPPWSWARALIADGVVDENFGITPRAYRLLGKAAPRPVGAPPPITFGILAVDAARARLFVLHTPEGEYMPTVEPLVELSQTTNPEERTRDSNLFADTRPGLHREGPHGPSHGVSDRRDRHRRDVERRFAAQISKDALHAWRAQGVTRVILVASPAMLGMLRPAMFRAKDGKKPWSVREMARDLTQLAAPALHDVLAADGLLPPRGRLPSLRPSPGMPIE